MSAWRNFAAFLAMTTTLAAAEPRAALSLNLAKPIPAAAAWKQKHWQVEGGGAPAGWMPVSEGGALRLETVDGKPCVAVKGTVCVGQPRFRVGRYYLCRTRAKGAPIRLYLNAKEALLRGGDAEDWTETAALHVPEAPGTDSCFLEADGTAWIAALEIDEFAEFADAALAGLPNFRVPPPDIITGGGDMEQTVAFSADERKAFADGKHWTLSQNRPVCFRPHSCYEGKKFQLVEDPAASHSGNNCLEFTNMCGAEFMMRPDKTYVFSFYAKGSGKLGVYGGVYGGPEGAALGNISIGEWFVASPDWTAYTAVLKAHGVKGHESETVSALPVFNTGDGDTVMVDDVSVRAIDRQEALLAAIAKTKAALGETLGAKSGDAKLAGLQAALDKELDALAAKVGAAKDLSDGDLQSQAEGLAQLTKTLSSVLDFN